MTKLVLGAVLLIAIAGGWITGRAINANLIQGIPVDIQSSDRVDGRVLTLDTSAGTKLKLEAVSATAGVNSITAGTNVTLGGTAADPVINASGGGSTSITVNQGGAAFATGVDTLDIVGQTLSRSGSTLTVTNAVSTTAFLSGDGSATTPVSPTYESRYFTLDGSNQLTLRAGQTASTGIGIDRLSTSGSQILLGTSTNGVIQQVGPFGALQINGTPSLIVNCRAPIYDATSAVSMTYDGRVFDLNGSGELALRLGNGLVADDGIEVQIPVQAGGNPYLDKFSTINFSGSELSRSGDTLTVTNKVSVTNVITGDGTPGFALDVMAGSTNTFLRTSSVGAVSFAALNVASPISGNGSSTSLDVTLNEPLLDSSGVSLRYTQPLTLDGSNNLKVLTGQGLTVSEGLELAMVWQDEGSGTTAADTGNVSGALASVSHSGGVATVNVSPTTVQDSAGQNIGSFPYIRLGSNLTGSVAQPDVLLVTAAGGGTVAVKDEGGASLGNADTLNVSGTQAEMTFSGSTGTVNVTSTTFQDVVGSPIGSFPYIRLGSGFTKTVAQPDVLLLDVPAPTSTVSTASPITGDGSGGSPVDLLFAVPLVDSSGLSLTYDDKFTLDGSSQLDLRLGQGLREEQGVGLWALAQQGGADFAFFNRLNITGGLMSVTNSGSAATLNFTQNVSASSPLTGDGVATPLDLSIGTGLEDSAGSLRAALVIASPLSGTGGATALDVTLNEPLLDSSGISLRYANPMTLDGSNNLVLKVGEGLAVQDGLQANILAQQGGTDFTYFDRLNITGGLFTVTHSGSGSTLNFTQNVSTTGSLTGDGVATAIAVGATTGVTGTAQATSDGSGTALALANHEHDTNLRVQTNGGNNLGLFDTIRGSASVAITDGGSGVAVLAAAPATANVTGTAQANAAGVATTYSLSDHEHNTNLRVQGNGGHNVGLFHTVRGSGSVSFTDGGSGVAVIAAAPATANVTGTAQANAAGVAATYALSDHEHLTNVIGRTASGGNLGLFHTLEHASATLSGGVLTIPSSSGLSAASQTEMESASSNTVAATPGRTQNHPGVAKGWAHVGLSGAVIETNSGKGSYNVTSYTDNGAGDLTVTWATDFGGADDYVAFVNIEATSNWNADLAQPSVVQAISNGGQAAGSTRFLSCEIDEGTVGTNNPFNEDPLEWHIVAFGDQ